MDIIEQINKTKDIHLLLQSFLAVKKRLLDDEIGVATSLTDPVGQFAEYLTLKTFGGVRTKNGTTGCDVIDKKNIKIEVKGRLKKHETYKPKTYINDSNLQNKTFDYLVYIVFDTEFNVEYAFGVKRSNFKNVFHTVQHKNSRLKWLIKAREDLLTMNNVDNLTKKIQRANKALKRN
ncbi:hypothetical protein AB4179_15310 [Vibrio lentus]